MEEVSYLSAVSVFPTPGGLTPVSAGKQSERMQ